MKKKKLRIFKSGLCDEVVLLMALTDKYICKRRIYEFNNAKIMEGCICFNHISSLFLDRNKLLLRNKEDVMMKFTGQRKRVDVPMCECIGMHWGHHEYIAVVTVEWNERIIEVAQSSSIGQ